MIRKKRISHYFFFHFKTRHKSTATCSVSLDPPPATARNPIDHKALCFSLADSLFHRGQLSSAQQVIQRIITHSSTAHDAISTVDFATSRGMELGTGIYGAFVRKLIDLGQYKFAYTVYFDRIIGSGIEPDFSIINSMIICFVKLGKLEDARLLFYKIIGNGCVPCNAACNVILREFCGKDMFLEAFDCFVRISEAKVQLGMWCYNVLIDGLCCKGCVGEVMQVFDIMQERSGFLPTLHNYKSLFYGLCKRGWVVEAQSVCREMEAHGYFVDKVMYTSLMNAYFKDNKIKMGIGIFLRMLKMGCEPDTLTYTTLIQGIVRMGFFEKGWMLYNQMNELRLQPDAVTYHVLISSYCSVGEVDCARMVLNKMAHSNLVPSVHSYTALIAALNKDNRFSEIDGLYKNRFAEIDELYRDMLKHGVVPDHVLFLILVKNGLRGNELQFCLFMLQEILKHGLGLEPQLLSCSTIVNPVMNLEQEIELLLEKIVRSSSSLARVAFCIYISALCESGKTDAAFSCLRKMVDVGCIPLPFAFNSLIKCFCQNGLFDSVKSVIDIMQDWGIVPDLATYLIMVNEYCQQKDLASAFLVLDQMEERGLKPSIAIYETLFVTMINDFFRNGRASEAHQLFERMTQNAIPPSSHSYTALISGLVKNNEIDKGCEYLDRMLREGIMPNVVFYTSLIHHFLRKGEFAFAFRLVDLMDRSQINFDLIMCIALVSGVVSGVRRNITGNRKRLCKVSRASERISERLLQLLHQTTCLPRGELLRFSVNSYEAMQFSVLKLIWEIKGLTFMPNLYLYNGIIAGFCWVDRIEDAYTQFELMQREGICPNQVTYTILIGAYSRAGKIDHAIELFNLMNANIDNPDRVAYNTLLRGLCKAGRELDALSLFFAMQKRGFVPNKSCYENLLRLFCARYLSIPAFKMFKEMLAYNYIPRQYTIEWLLHVLHEDERLLEVHMAWDMMSDRAITKSIAEPIVC